MATAPTFLKLKDIDDHIKLLAFGYVRQLVKGNNLTPKDIIHICILYSLEYDQFDEHSVDIQLSSKDLASSPNNRARNVGFGWRSAYGKYKIECARQSNAIFEWIFDINADAVSIGICSIDVYRDGEKTRLFHMYCFGSANENGTYYALGNDGVLEYQDLNGAWNKGQEEKIFYEKKTQKGDTVKMILDISNKSLNFIRNDVNVGIAYSDIDTSKIYTMAVSMTKVQDDEDCVQLNKFSVRYN